MPLSELEARIAAFSEQQWFLTGHMPTPETLADTFGISRKKLNELLSNLKTSFEERGMPIIEGRTLSPQQVSMANQMLNLADQRSNRKKLSDNGITPTKWDGWMQNPDFKEYMMVRSKQILDGAIPEAHLALVENVKRGDLGSLKFYYEMTGFYTGKDQAIDPRAILNKVLEIIMRHVKDPETLKAIASEILPLSGLDSPAKLGTSQVVKGEIL